MKTFIILIALLLPVNAHAECQAFDIIDTWDHEVTGMATDGLLVKGPCYITKISHSWGNCTFWLYDGEAQFYEHTSIMMDSEQHEPLLCPKQIHNGVNYRVEGLCSVVIEYARP